jgi:hypothetical protein
LYLEPEQWAISDKNELTLASNHRDAGAVQLIILCYY